MHGAGVALEGAAQAFFGVGWHGRRRGLIFVVTEPAGGVLHDHDLAVEAAAHHAKANVGFQAHPLRPWQIPVMVFRQGIRHMFASPHNSTQLIHRRDAEGAEEKKDPSALPSAFHNSAYSASPR